MTYRPPCDTEIFKKTSKFFVAIARSRALAPETLVFRRRKGTIPPYASVWQLGASKRSRAGQHGAVRGGNATTLHPQTQKIRILHLPWLALSQVIAAAKLSTFWRCPSSRSQERVCPQTRSFRIFLSHLGMLNGLVIHQLTARDEMLLTVWALLWKFFSASSAARRPVEGKGQEVDPEGVSGPRPSLQVQQKLTNCRETKEVRL